MQVAVVNNALIPGITDSGLNLTHIPVEVLSDPVVLNSKINEQLTVLYREALKIVTTVASIERSEILLNLAKSVEACSDLLVIYNANLNLTSAHSATAIIGALAYEISNYNKCKNFNAIADELDFTKAILRQAVAIREVYNQITCGASKQYAIADADAILPILSNSLKYICNIYKYVSRENSYEALRDGFQDTAGVPFILWDTLVAVTDPKNPLPNRAVSKLIFPIGSLHFLGLASCNNDGFGSAFPKEVYRLAQIAQKSIQDFLIPSSN